MTSLVKRRPKKSQFQRASDGSMSLIEHFQELRTRLFRASLGVVVGFGLGWWFAQPALDIIKAPYEHLCAHRTGCQLMTTAPADTLVLQMRVALWLGLVVAAPIWLYQLWAFIAPGLHRHERRWAYWFAGLATPLFAGGAVMAFFVVSKGLDFLLQFAGKDVVISLEIQGYVNFVVNVMLLFGLAFEFPLVVVLFNLAGLATYQRLLKWWRTAVFLTFVFAAVVTPTADPFGMSVLALALSTLYFAAVGFAYVHDKRKARKNPYADLSDDEISPIEPSADDPIAGGEAERWEPVAPAAPVAAPKPLDQRFDDMT